MGLSTVVFLLIRPLHVLLAACWIGSAVFMTYVLMPAINDTGSAGGQVMLALHRKGMNTFFAAIGGLTVVSGLYLYWRFTGGFDPEVSRTHAGLAFGIGGVSGILALIIGGSVVGRSAQQVVDIMTKVARMNDGIERTALLQRAAMLRQRMTSVGNVVILFQAIALVLMALGHYI